MVSNAELISNCSKALNWAVVPGNRWRHRDDTHVEIFADEKPAEMAMQMTLGSKTQMVKIREKLFKPKPKSAPVNPESIPAVPTPKVAAQPVARVTPTASSSQASSSAKMDILQQNDPWANFIQGKAASKDPAPPQQLALAARVGNLETRMDSMERNINEGFASIKELLMKR